MTLLRTALKLMLILLLAGCWLAMPYGYYELLRMAALIGFALLAYDSYAGGAPREAIVYGCLALLFQPFVKVALGRSLWQGVDAVVAGLLLLSLLRGNIRKAPGRPEP